MRVQVKARHGHVNDSVRRYAEEKLGKLGPRLHDLTVIELTLSREHNPSIVDDHAAEAILHVQGSEHRRPRAGPDVGSGDRPADRQARAAGRTEARHDDTRAAPSGAARAGRSLRRARRCRRARLGGVSGLSRLPHEPGPHWGEVGIHGLHRAREWDAVAARRGARAAGSRMRFVVLRTARCVVEAGDGAPASPSSCARVERAPPLPGARQCAATRSTWAVGVRGILVVELPASVRRRRARARLGRPSSAACASAATPTLASVAELEALASARYDTWVVRAQRLRDTLWEVEVGPLRGLPVAMAGPGQVIREQVPGAARRLPGPSARAPTRRA